MVRKGLNAKEVEERQKKFGKNELAQEKKVSLFIKILLVIKEPMFLLLLVAATIYFILGEPRDGAIMLVFVVGVITIETFQEWKTDKTLKALKDLSSPRVKVIRDGNEIEISSVDLVPDDLMIIYEGVKVPADGFVIETNGVCIDESSLTGEPEGKWKIVHDPKAETNDYFKNDFCYAGTLVTQGIATVLVSKIGRETEFGKIGQNVVNAELSKSPLEKQTAVLVKICAVIAFALFLLVGVATFFILVGHTMEERIIESVLSGITVAMAMIPEEFPVVLTVFLSMGAWRLAKKHSLVRKLPAVETLGAVTVLCVDKTGTITQNKMTVEQIDTKVDPLLFNKAAAMACEQNTFDSMEKAIVTYANAQHIDTEKLFKNKIYQAFPFTNENKMMGNTYELDGKKVLSVKGAYERVLPLCTNLSESESVEIKDKALDLSRHGLRVLAVASREVDGLVDDLANLQLTYLGLIAFMDPPRENVDKHIATCYKAGIRVVMITGDNGTTASAIARKIGLRNNDHVLTGEEIDQLSDEELKAKLPEISIFSRVIPQHKMRIVTLFQELGEVVAMTGDGVNDAPALKHADIGIAMGKRGSEVSREAADLILMDDNFETIVDTIEDGRRIYDNIKKAVGYIFAIHVPIALSALLGPLLGLSGNLLFLLPLHVMLLELLIDPTCSVVLERQPAEADIMSRKPRSLKAQIISKGFLFKSLIQGFIMFIASFGSFYIMSEVLSKSPEEARSFALAVLFLSNILLVNVNASSRDSMFKSFKSLFHDKVLWIINLSTIALLVVLLYTPINTYLKLTALPLGEAALVVGISVVSVCWYEVVKLIKRLRKK